MSVEQPKWLDCNPSSRGCVCIFSGEIIEIIEMNERGTTKMV